MTRSGVLLTRRKFSISDIDRILRQLPAAAGEPDGARLHKLANPAGPPLCTDWLSLSLWQDRQSGEVWVHASGGIAGVDVWYGPGKAEMLTT
jgi:hypothetical protein